MLWISGGLVLVFGGLTLYFHDQRFIQMKPTLVYLMFAAVLAFGLATGRPLLQALLGAAYPGLTEAGWRKLTRNWALFFAAMAVANEVVWRSASAGTCWVGVQVVGRDPADAAVRGRQRADADAAWPQTDAGAAAGVRHPARGRE